MTQRRLVLFLPMYNEEGCIYPLLDRAQEKMATAYNFSMVIVNDGSSDGSAAKVRSHPLFKEGKIQLIEHEKNSGLGAALATGVRTLAQSDLPDDTIIITMDADNTHDPAATPRMLEELDKGFDVVVSSRYHPEAVNENVPWFRKLLSLGAYWFMHFLLPIDGVKDYSCGYRAYRLGIIKKAWGIFGKDLITSQGFSCMVEILVKLSTMGAKASEAPILFDYGKKAGKSKIRVLKTIMGYVKLTFSMRKALKQAQVILRQQALNSNANPGALAGHN